MKVTIVIPNYNGKKFLKTCMDALEHQTCRAFEILIVDNASADGSVEYIKEHYPFAKLIELDKNYGFSRAVNEGIRQTETPYVILLNNDTEVYPDYVEELLAVIEQSEKIFSVSPKMIQMYQPDLLDDAGDLYCILGWAFQRGVGHKVSGYNKACSVFSSCAGAAIYRRKVFDEIGFFDESHFAYLEDIDVGYRAKIAGYKNMYGPKAKVLHVGSGTSGSKYNDFKVKLAARNGIYLNYKNMPALQLLINIPWLCLGILIKYFFFKKRGFSSAYTDGLKEGIRTCRSCKKVKFQPGRVGIYLKIEGELFKNMAIYGVEFIKRKIKS